MLAEQEGDIYRYYNLKKNHRPSIPTGSKDPFSLLPEIDYSTG
jgi:hypothetical protein